VLCSALCAIGAAGGRLYSAHKWANSMVQCYPNDPDADSLRKVAAAGADMGRPMVIEYSIDAPNEMTAKRVAELVAPRGYDPLLSHDEQSGAWSVYCSRLMPASDDGIVAAQSELNDVVTAHGAICDGWGNPGNANG
jgi:hypothetical protein